MKNKLIITAWLLLGFGFFGLSLVPNLVYLPAYADKMLHMNVYALFVMLPVIFLTDIRYALAIAAALLLIGVGMEYAQTFVAGRNASGADMIANALGVCAGLIIGGLHRIALKPREIATITLLLLMFVPHKAQAQFLTRGDRVVSVAERADPDFDAIGGQLGGFKVNAGIEAEQKFDDNIYRNESNAQSDSITVFRPVLTISPDTALHEIKLTAGADIGRYWNHTDENYADFGADIAGRFDLDIGTNIRGNIGYARLHEDRGSPNDPDGDTPVEYDILTTGIGAARELGVLKLRLAAQDQRITYDNTTLNGAVIDNGYRDRSVQNISARLAYELSPATEIFTVPSYSWTSYEQSGANDRSSQGYDIIIGAAHDITGKLHTDLYAGYFDREMDNANFKDINGAKYGGSLLWNMTDITSLKGNLGRQIRETTQTAASGYIQTNASLGLEHALTYRTLIEAGIGWANYDFEGHNTSGNREDDIIQGKLEGRYKLMNGTAIKAGYIYTDRDSNIGGNSYTNNIFNLGVGYAY
jgi:hypothetical protein